MDRWRVLYKGKGERGGLFLFCQWKWQKLHLHHLFRQWGWWNPLHKAAYATPISPVRMAKSTAPYVALCTTWPTAISQFLLAKYAPILLFLLVKYVFRHSPQQNAHTKQTPFVICFKTDPNWELVSKRNPLRSICHKTYIYSKSNYIIFNQKSFYNN